MTVLHPDPEGVSGLRKATRAPARSAMSVRFAMTILCTTLPLASGWIAR
ncbi:hypothetical protein M2171_001237 [Bradyrhizobium japonicum USDA 38]|nr:hypothetical protein [Bradyrhizobium japonicum USDA 38]MCS3944618.1 hypothetical protein [Bradyrhizobium japonicum]